MPKFIPNVRPEDISYDSERAVYRALSTLPPEYVVLHSFPWLRPCRDLLEEPLREGEADFVVLHPNRGLLVLEVKGGFPVLCGRQWMRGGKVMRDPFEQARRSRYALLDSVEERSCHRVHRGLFAHGDLVVFPHARYEGPLPLNADSRIVIDALGLDDMPHKIEEGFRAWSRCETHLSHSQFSELLGLLMPKLRLFRCASAEVAAERERIVQITLDQRTTLLGLLANERVLVEGTAGSGKTLLALEFALTLAEQGQSTLLLCYNRNLALWLQEQVIGDPRYNSAKARLEIATFHAFAFSIARQSHVEFTVPNENCQSFWDEEVPLILEQALEVLASSGRTKVFDAVIVDESQDFSPDWWVTVESLTRRGRAGRLYSFVDLNQSLRGEPRYPSLPFQTRFYLSTNCRNTRAIARSSAALAKTEVSLLPGTPMGELPVTRRAPSAASEGGLVLAEVRQLLQQGLLPRQIALIGPAPHDKSCLSQFREVGGFPLIEDAREWRRGTGVLVTTARAFKGLEAEVVVAYGLSKFGELFSPTDLYVAWTRACHRLILVCQTGEVRAAVETALAEAERAMTKPVEVNKAASDDCQS